MSSQEEETPSTEKFSSMKAQVYKDPRPSEYFDRFHKRAREKRPNAVYEIARTLTSLYGWILFRTRCVAAYNVPVSGSVILAPNHFSFMDHFFAGMFIRRRTNFMGKSQLFKGWFAEVLYAGCVFPVRRGHRDEEAFTTANTILSKGGCVTMYCEGGRSRTGSISDQAKPGIGRLALQSGAWIVPIAIYGSSRVRNWKRLQFPRVAVLYGKPIRWEQIAEPTRQQAHAVADQILNEIRKLYNSIDVKGSKGLAKRVREVRKAALSELTG